MANTFKSELSEDQQKHLEETVEEKADVSLDFVKSLFSGKGVSSSKMVDMIPFISFLALLAMFYIGNRHHAEDRVRKMQELTKEVKNLSWEYKTITAEVMQKSTETHIASMVDTLGLKDLVVPPIRLEIK